MPPVVNIIRPNITEEEREENIKGIIHAANNIVKEHGLKIVALHKVN